MKAFVVVIKIYLFAPNDATAYDIATDIVKDINLMGYTSEIETTNQMK